MHRRCNDPGHAGDPLLPWDAEHWPRDSRQPDGLRKTCCRACWRRRAAERRAAKKRAACAEVIVDLESRRPEPPAPKLRVAPGPAADADVDVVVARLRAVGGDGAVARMEGAISGARRMRADQAALDGEGKVPPGTMEATAQQCFVRLEAAIKGYEDAELERVESADAVELERSLHDELAAELARLDAAREGAA